MHKQTLQIGTEYGSQYAGTYVFQEITWAKRSRIIQKNTKYHALTGQVLSSDFIAIQAQTIWAALKQQPPSQPLTLDKLQGEEDGIPIALGELLSSTVNQLCTVSREENAFLSEPSDDKNPTMQSQSLGSAKNSAGPPSSSPSSPPESSSNSPSSSTR
ncbi:MAG: hypothetical protein NWF04_06245 [Candidatus Bathyarchaeota archaeon]|nr:hypothetical protein [Candidatus Bathyarchaeota archaeon]